MGSSFSSPFRGLFISTLVNIQYKNGKMFSSPFRGLFISTITQLSLCKIWIVFVPFPGSLYFYLRCSVFLFSCLSFRPLSGVSLFLQKHSFLLKCCWKVFVPFPGSLYFYPILYTHYKSRS